MSLSLLLAETKIADSNVDELRNMVEWQSQVHKTTAVVYSKVFGNSSAPSLNFVSKRKIRNGVNLYIEVQEVVTDHILKSLKKNNL